MPPEAASAERQNVTVADVVSALHAWAPPALAASYDNVGLLIGDAAAAVTGALCTLDVTDAVLDEALALGCNTLVAHHPAWFGAKTRLTEADWTGRLLRRAIRHDLNLVAVHTNLDHITGGVSFRMAEQLGLADVRILEPLGADLSTGAGVIGRLLTPLSPPAFLAQVKSAFGASALRYAQAHHVRIERVALCGGSGSFLIGAARAAGAQALVTADVTYHKFFDAEGDLLLVDVGHFESERFTPELLAAYLTQKFPTFASRISGLNTNPVLFFV